MANRNTSITINGQRYEAQSGSIMATPPTRSLDGLVRGRPTVPSGSVAGPLVTKPAAAPKSAIARQAAAPARPHHIKPSATLMRQAVSKPQTASLKRHTKVHSSTLALASKPAAIKPKTVIHSVNQPRLMRAKQAPVSPRVSRFSPVAKAPLLVNPAALTTVKPIYRPDVVGGPKSAAPVTDVFEHALARANSHEQPTPKVATRTGKRRGRWLAYLGGGLALLLIGGFISLQAMGGLRFKMASNKAGFSVTMPSYKPSGYSVAQLKASAGFFGITFNGTNSSFALTEKPSNWNSATLLSNVVGNNQSFDTIEAAGRTVYLYGKDQAAWVDNGILYQIANHSSLSSQQLANLASSM